MEPLHRISLIPQLPPPHFSLWRKITRYTHISGFVIVAFFFGVGFSEGVLTFANKSSSYVRDIIYSDPVTYTTSVATSTAERKGSDEKGLILPVSIYNVKGKVSGINADSYLVGDLDTGEIILVKDPEKVFPIASVSKLVTALVALDHFTSKQDVVVTKSSLATYGPSGGLQAGEKVKALDLLYPLLLESSNDVALLISEQFKPGEFPKLMNDKVQALGMVNSSYEEASGLSAKNVSTSNDLFKLAQYIYNETPHSLDITRIREFSLMNHTWNNYNFFLKDKRFIGGKNGYTDEALRTAVEFFDLPVKKGATTENHPIVIIVLHTETREQDINKLLDFLKKSVSVSE
jgi:serine-type D-Ala-D-Ala carboxypeptidase (penicillin-binding protein 5/6)